MCVRGIVLHICRYLSSRILRFCMRAYNLVLRTRSDVLMVHQLSSLGSHLFFCLSKIYEFTIIIILYH